MQRSKSSKRWLQEHFDDFYVKQAQAAGYRSRAVYKLQEIDDKAQLFKPGMLVVDLGAAPGGWTQYVSEKIGCQQHSRIIALDRLAMDALPGVEVILGDFTEPDVLARLEAMIPAHSVDVVLSDMAPNMSGNPEIDLPKAMYLAELAIDFARHTLKARGVLVLKLFHGAGFDALVKALRGQFKQVLVRKPKASRARSRETYVLAKDYIL